MTDEAVSADEHQAQHSPPPISILSQLTGDSQHQLAALAEVPLEVEIRLGQITVPLAELLQLEPGSVVTLDRSLEEMVEVVAGGKVVAYGEIVAVGEQLGVRILEIAPSEDSLAQPE